MAFFCFRRRANAYLLKTSIATLDIYLEGFNRNISVHMHWLYLPIKIYNPDFALKSYYIQSNPFQTVLSIYIWRKMQEKLGNQITHIVKKKKCKLPVNKTKVCFMFFISSKQSITFNATEIIFNFLQGQFSIIKIIYTFRAWWK